MLHYLYLRKPSPVLAALAAFTMGAACLSAQVSEPPTPPIPGETPKKPSVPQHPVQLGITVSKPSAAVYAQLPKLPPHSGFVLQSVTPGGTADVAGLKPMDVLWKFGDQLIINEAQLMVLLSHHHPGDKVKVGYFHSGEEKVATLELQEGSAKPPIPGVMTLMPPLPTSPAFPVRVISYEDRSASISDKNGTATLTFREGKPWLHIESSQGEEIYNGHITESSDLARVPLAWRNRLPVLQRSLEESIRLRRLPRVRRVPTPKKRIARDSP